MMIADASVPQTEIQRKALAAAEQHLDGVVALSRHLHAHPEQAFAEHSSAALLTGFLADVGFAITNPSSLPTAFTASYGAGELSVGICVEYDALPNGHACGHNLIAGASLLAGAALKAVADDVGFRILVIGTPAEEHGAGKAVLLSEGIFDDVHCALMIHPMPDGCDTSPLDCTSQAVARWRATYVGKSAHAAGAPDQGINAADAVAIVQVAVGLLRQQLKDGFRVGMIVREAGQSTNIIPEKALVEFECRAPDLAEFERLYQRVERCFEAGALATGCTLSIEQFEPTYEPLLQDPVLSKHWCDAFARLGRPVDYRPWVQPASTDFGNISQALPALHPWVAIAGTHDALHTDGFREAALSEPGFTTMIDGAVAMVLAWLGVCEDSESREYLLRRAQERRQTHS